MTTYAFADRPIHCGSAQDYDQLLQANLELSGVLIDVRTQAEIGDLPLAKLPEGWIYCRIPITGQTISEQDMDVFRREFFRKQQTVVIDPGSKRSDLLVIASLARQKKEALPPSSIDSTKERDLFAWLQAYLARHGCPSTP